MSANESHPTPYKVSTITAVASISTCVDLDVFFEQLTIGPDVSLGDDSGMFLFAGKGSHGTYMTRGERVNRPKKSATSRPRFFDHQVTVIYTSSTNAQSPRETHNAKVFHNGNIQLTGVKTLEGGKKAVEYIASHITKIAQEFPNILPLGLSKAPPTVVNYRACLINSDFNVGYILRRDVLCSLITHPSIGVRCVFETYYPGVKIQFMWNQERDHLSQNGVCDCMSPCSGRGDGSSLRNCRKITISVFQSGCCIITGAHTYKQLDDAYAFIIHILTTHKQILVRPASSPILKTTRLVSKVRGQQSIA